MIKRRFISVRLLKPDMIIDQAVKDKLGRSLIVRGAKLEDYQIDALQKMGVNGVYIREGEEDPEEEKKEVEIPKPVREKIEKLTVEDKSKVKLTESVKKRVSEGMQYIYSNVESEHLAEAADSIAVDLMKSIEENDAIAVDIGMLKVSDEYTFKHSVDVATIGMVIASKYGMTKKQVHDIGIVGLLHDIGKSKIPNEVLNKAGKLTDEEFAIMRQHPVIGYHILQEKKNVPKEIMEGVLEHHEKINGKGYPIGLSGEKINPYAKVIAVADIYDALVTERPYKKPMTQRDAVEMIMTMTDEIEINVMKSFLNSVILYPVGSIVQLSNGETAKVVENNMQYILRPKVVGLKTGKVYDLAEDLKCASIIIQ